MGHAEKARRMAPVAPGNNDSNRQIGEPNA